MTLHNLLHRYPPCSPPHLVASFPLCPQRSAALHATTGGHWIAILSHLWGSLKFFSLHILRSAHLGFSYKIGRSHVAIATSNLWTSQHLVASLPTMFSTTLCCIVFHHVSTNILLVICVTCNNWWTMDSHLWGSSLTFLIFIFRALRTRSKLTATKRHNKIGFVLISW